MWETITIKGVHPRYTIQYNGSELRITNQKGRELGSVYHYNSPQKTFMICCTDGKSRTINSLRLLFAYTNNISVLDIPKGCIYRTKYGLQYYNKRKITREILPQHLTPAGEDAAQYIQRLDDWWRVVKEATLSGNMCDVADALWACREKVLQRLRCRIHTTKEIIDDCFGEAVLQILRRLREPRYGWYISLPEDTLVKYTYKIYARKWKKQNTQEVYNLENMNYESIYRREN